MAKTGDGGDTVAEVLSTAGVDTIMSMAGGHVTSIFEAVPEEKIRSVVFRDERAAGFAAAAWGALTRKPGVCLVTAGPGLTNAVTGLAQAQRSGWPVISIAGAFEVFSQDRGGLQEMAQSEFMAPISKWSRTVSDPRRIGEYVERALQAATTPPYGHAHLSIPVDLLSLAIPDRPQKREPDEYLGHTLGGLSETAIARITEELKGAERPVLIAGPGVWFADGQDALRRFVEKTGMPTFTHEEARGLLSDEHPCCVGEILYRLSGAVRCLERADVVVVVGCNPDWRLEYLDPPLVSEGVKVVLIDSNPEHLVMTRPTSVRACADEANALAMLATVLPDSNARWDAWRGEMKAAQQEHRRNVLEKEPAAHPDRAVPAVTVVRLVAEACIRDDANVVFDGGNTGKWGKLVVPATRPGQWNRVKGPFASIGHGLPSAIARRLSDPSHPCVLYTGDGSFGYHVAEVETAVREGADLTAVILIDGAWGSVQEMQFKRFGGLEGTLIPRTRFDQAATALGAKGYWIEDAESLEGLLAEPHEGVRVVCVNTETAFPPIQYPPGRYARGDDA